MTHSTTTQITSGVLGAFLVIVGTVACASPADPASSRRTTVTTSPEPYAMLTDPADILGLADLTLPPNATDTTAASFPPAHEYQSYAYLVTFTAPAPEIEEFISHAIGVRPLDLFPITTEQLTQTYKQVGITSVPEGTRSRSQSIDTIGGRGNLVTVVEGPDLTHVRVGLTANTR